MTSTPVVAARRRSGPGTLGDLLYGGAAAAASPAESDWVGLVRSMAAGDQRALQALFQRTRRIVFTLVVRITNSPETAEEVTLDVYHDVWRRASSYDPAGGSVVGWIMNQARSRAIDRLRFEQRKKRTVPRGKAPLPAARAADPQQAFDLREQARALRGALAALTPDERLAIEMAFFTELTYREVADRLELPLGTVKTRIRSGLEKLRRALEGSVKDP